VQPFVLKDILKSCTYLAKILLPIQKMMIKLLKKKIPQKIATLFLLTPITAKPSNIYNHRISITKSSPPKPFITIFFLSVEHRLHCKSPKNFISFTRTKKQRPIDYPYPLREIFSSRRNFVNSWADRLTVGDS
jgi:hypothetical protein